MATEVEPVLPRSALLQQQEQERCQAQTDGGVLVKEQSLERAEDESNSPAKESPAPAEEDASKKEFTEAPPPKLNPWTKKMSGVNGQITEHSGPTKVVKAGNARMRRGGKVGDFGDANNWPTPGEIATKEVQVPQRQKSSISTIIPNDFLSECIYGFDGLWK
ncbi:la-related protein 1-like [Sinocyclocheilus grahami]|uniref:la-related protein 1-like n=1 Tax=Sinocyclocheilus grahami TaxID=75366 RepID=UPI0007ACAD8D|nr:PREDICTED: la-related protein 1-like [Sinocyclocheilus grahami]